MEFPIMLSFRTRKQDLYYRMLCKYLQNNYVNSLCVLPYAIRYRQSKVYYEGSNFNSGKYLFTTDTK